jgi:hypothetical protein
MIRCEPPSVVEKAQLAGRVVPSESLHAVRLQGLEGFMGKRKDSLYGAGKRSGPSIQYRLNRGQELVIDGYILSQASLKTKVAEEFPLLFTVKTRVTSAAMMSNLTPSPSQRAEFPEEPEADFRSVHDDRGLARRTPRGDSRVRPANKGRKDSHR